MQYNLIIKLKNLTSPNCTYFKRIHLDVDHMSILFDHVFFFPCSGVAVLYFETRRSAIVNFADSSFCSSFSWIYHLAEQQTCTGHLFLCNHRSLRNFFDKTQNVLIWYQSWSTGTGKYQHQQVVSKYVYFSMILFLIIVC